MIVDAGGGTIDVSSYKRKSSKATGTSLRNHTYGEIAIPQCSYNHFFDAEFNPIWNRSFSWIRIRHDSCETISGRYRCFAGFHELFADCV